MCIRDRLFTSLLSLFTLLLLFTSLFSLLTLLFSLFASLLSLFTTSLFVSSVVLSFVLSVVVLFVVSSVLSCTSFWSLTSVCSFSTSGALSDTYKSLINPSLSPFLTLTQLSWVPNTSTFVDNPKLSCTSDSICASFLKFTFSAVTYASAPFTSTYLEAIHPSFPSFNWTLYHPSCSPIILNSSPE